MSKTTATTSSLESAAAESRPTGRGRHSESLRAAIVEANYLNQISARPGRPARDSARPVRPARADLTEAIDVCITTR